jgi:hypothetical protein
VEVLKDTGHPAGHSTGGGGSATLTTSPGGGGGRGRQWVRETLTVVPFLFTRPRGPTRLAGPSLLASQAFAAGWWQTEDRPFPAQFRKKSS